MTPDASASRRPDASSHVFPKASAVLDRALLVDVLGLPESLCAAGGPLETLRRKLAAEPQIHGGKRTRVVFTDTGERTVKRAGR